MPAWVIWATFIVFAALHIAMKMHTGQRGEPVTIGDLEDRLAANNLELRDMRETIGKLPMEPVGGDSGATYAELPNGTRAVKLPDGTIRLALPVRLSASLREEGGGSARLKPLPKDGAE